MIRTLRELFGLERSTTSHHEKLIAGLGAGFGIAAIYFLSSWILPDFAAGLMIASMGATAVLLFAVPHGPLSQPWAVLAGHFISAVIGVSCQQWLGHLDYAPALAVGLAVAAMCYCRCIHPPGGATALAAVIGGPEVHALGYSYLLAPVALNLAAIMFIALVFNNFFAWRRYPAALMPAAQARSVKTSPLHLTHEDLTAAMHDLDTYVDVTSEELAVIFEKAWAHARRSRREPLGVGVGRYYSNAGVGHNWCIREVLEMAEDPQARDARLLYKNVAGADTGETGLCSLEEFARWASFEVVYEYNRWVKALPGDEADQTG